MKNGCRSPSFWIALGGALGALSRHGVECAAHSLLHPYPRFPWGTFGINLAGSFLLGWILSRAETGAPGGEFWRYFAGVGFCGAFTTFSTLNLEMIKMMQSGSLGLAAVYFVASFVCGIVMASLGASLGVLKRGLF